MTNILSCFQPTLLSGYYSIILDIFYTVGDGWAAPLPAQTRVGLLCTTAQPLQCMDLRLLCTDRKHPCTDHKPRCTTGHVPRITGDRPPSQRVEGPAAAETHQEVPAPGILTAAAPLLGMSQLASVLVVPTTLTTYCKISYRMSYGPIYS